MNAYELLEMVEECEAHGLEYTTLVCPRGTASHWDGELLHQCDQGAVYRVPVRNIRSWLVKHGAS